ncbi:hypothetical protein GCM10020220_066180 [Nonomuraea rubra]
MPSEAAAKPGRPEAPSKTRLLYGGRLPYEPRVGGRIPAPARTTMTTTKSHKEKEQWLP